MTEALRSFEQFNRANVGRERSAVLHSKSLHFLHTEIARRFDGSYAVYCTVTYGDLDLVPPSVIKEAIQSNSHWMNPLTWAIIGTTMIRAEAEAMAQKVKSSGSPFVLTARYAKGTSS